MKLLPVHEARARMLAEVAPLAAEQAPLSDSIGRTLAEDIAAARDQPPFDGSAMDGWAVRSGDTPGTLAIAGESAAGHGYAGVVGPGQAVRIFTGGAMPAGCDAVVIQEDATRDGDRVTVPEAAPRRHVRPAGGDFKAGDVLLTAGTRIDPWRLSLAASAGRGDVSVHRRPRVTVLSTGEEIVEPPLEPGPYQIYNSGSPALVALLQSWGADARRVKPVRDDMETTIAALREADGDLVVTIGGASVGDHDLVRAAGQALGLELKVASVAVRPGKPTFFGLLGDGRRMLGLPGNPASAFVCAELFLKPLIARYCGREAEPVLTSARLEAALPANGDREHWMRARTVQSGGETWVSPYSDQDSSLVSVFALADALLRRLPHAPSVRPGEVVEILRLSRAAP